MLTDHLTEVSETSLGNVVYAIGGPYLHSGLYILGSSVLLGVSLNRVSYDTSSLLQHEHL